MRNAAMEVMRYDMLTNQVGEFNVEGTVVCSWVQNFKPRQAGENPDRALKMTAENLFITLADPTNEPDEETVRLIQFLALMLERKRLLRPKGKSTDGQRAVYEHAKTKQLFEVPAGEFDPAFFVAVQAQLSVLVGSPKEDSTPAASDENTAPTEAAPVADPS